MKKTFIALLCATSCAMGTTLPSILCDVSDTSVSGGTAASFSNFTGSSITVSLTLNVTALRDISDVNFAGASEVYRYYELNGTWDTGATGKIAAANNGSSGNDATGVYMGATIDVYNDKEALSGNGGALNFPNNNVIFSTSTDWDSIEAVTLTFSYDGSPTEDNWSIANVAVGILNADGSITMHSSSNSPIVSSSYSERDFYASSISVNSTFVDSFTVYGGAMSIDQVKTVSSSRLIPEPTTATLSLLALAGLAARRRRK